MKRPLLLTGFMATGKSAVGRTLAAQCAVPHLDLDQLIQQRTGSRIFQIFQELGEPAFRRIERDLLTELLTEWQGRPVVVSLGGGALLDRETRVRALSMAVLVALEATATEIARRARAEDEAEAGLRPLLSGPEPDARIATLLAERRPSYRESHGQITTDGRTLADIATEVLGIWRRNAIVVAAGESTYGVVSGEGLTAAELPGLLGAPSGTLLVSDTTVEPLHGPPVLSALSALGVKSAEVLLTPGEQHKNLHGLTQIYEGAFAASLDRQAVFLGLGGGVVTDMTGFAAATWVRGVRWIGLPTTLLSMVDASVGGKTGLDFHTAKNSVGAFWQPSGVICDVTTLRTETQRMFVGALSEVLKTALIGDPALLSLLEDQTPAILRREPALLAELVERSVRVKALVVGLDERERGVRATLNLGHTIGHALEASGGYTALTHGEAVGLGLVFALRLGERLGHTPPDLTTRVVDLARRLGLPHRLGRQELERCTKLLGHDKKRAGAQVRFIFARAPGDVTMEYLPLATLSTLTPALADPG